MVMRPSGLSDKAEFRQCHNSGVRLPAERRGWEYDRLCPSTGRDLSRAAGAGVGPILCGLIALLTLGFSVLHWPSLPALSPPLPQRIARDVVAAASPLLQVFQVYAPVLTAEPGGSLELSDGSANGTEPVTGTQGPSCSLTLATYSFAQSYGAPFVGNYSPPSCSFNRVTINLTVVSAGKQFDRLGVLYFSDTEIFRTSTAEPSATGVEWTYLKDMTNYLPLFKQQQKIIFDLGNNIDNVYTAPYNVTLTASFFNAPNSVVPADLIVPVSARQSAENAPSVFTFPATNASNTLTLPRNIQRAVFTIAACGQANEEFWWSNVFSSDVNTFPSGALYGYSPFRELQLFIDGMLAGVAWPFPVIFTGGVVPGLWRPIVGIDAFDLREDEIDISPFLPLLCDGNPHTFKLVVSGVNDSGNGTAVLSETVGSNWPISGKIFIWLDPSNSTTTGSTISRDVPDPTFQLTSSAGKAANGSNATLEYSISAQRHLLISSTISTAEGSRNATWQQSLRYTNSGNYAEGGNLQVNNLMTSGNDVSSLNYARTIGYPLFASTLYGTVPGTDNITMAANVSRGKDVQTIGDAVFPTGLESFAVLPAVQQEYSSFQGATLHTTQNGSAIYIANQTTSQSFSFGTTEQDESLAGVATAGGTDGGEVPAVTQSTELYHRYVKAVNSSVVADDETVAGQPVSNVIGGPPDMGNFALAGAPLPHGTSPPGKKRAIPRRLRNF